VKVGGIAQAMMLPIISVGTLYMRHRGLPTETRPGIIVTGALWFAALVISAVMVYYLVLSLR
jgi:manganese transport protein